MTQQQIETAADECRERFNGYGPEKRAQLLAAGMRRIYGLMTPEAPEPSLDRISREALDELFWEEPQQPEYQI